ncbi:hypothetical protein O9992_07890 [Vibrio lentus]|nr:hypothetical protein [Vibrio lentus]
MIYGVSVAGWWMAEIPRCSSGDNHRWYCVSHERRRVYFTSH